MAAKAEEPLRLGGGFGRPTPDADAASEAHAPLPRSPGRYRCSPVPRRPCSPVPSAQCRHVRRCRSPPPRRWRPRLREPPRALRCRPRCPPPAPRRRLPVPAPLRAGRPPAGCGDAPAGRRRRLRRLRPRTVRRHRPEGTPRRRISGRRTSPSSPTAFRWRTTSSRGARTPRSPTPSSSTGRARWVSRGKMEGARAALETLAATRVPGDDFALFVFAEGEVKEVVGFTEDAGQDRRRGAAGEAVGEDRVSRRPRPHAREEPPGQERLEGHRPSFRRHRQRLAGSPSPSSRS